MSLASGELDGELDDICARFARGELSAPVALMRLLIAAEDVPRVAAQVEPQAELRRLLAANRPGCERICAMLRSGVDSPAAAATTASGLAFARRLFDWSVEASEESSVALYSLGNPDLLAAATAELVQLLDQWGLIAPHLRCLEIGCGIGRFQAALGPRVAEARGIDLSVKMIASARRRCATIPHTAFDVTDGRDLSRFGDGRFELVFAVDSFPYLVQAGMPLVETHLAEAARLLVSRGCLALFNFSYRDDLAGDRRDLARLARAHGFVVEIDGERPFRLWDGAAWRLRKLR